MENNENKKSVPEELNDDLLEKVSGGTSGTSKTYDYVFTHGGTESDYDIYFTGTCSCGHTREVYCYVWIELYQQSNTRICPICGATISEWKEEEVPKGPTEVPPTFV